MTSPPSAIVGAIPTPSYGHGGSWSIYCQSKLSAPPLTCLEVVLNATEYPEWNAFCRKCTIDKQPSSLPSNPTNDGDNAAHLHAGTEFTFEVHLDITEPEGRAGRDTQLKVSVLEAMEEGDGRKGWRVAWKTRPSTVLPGWMLRSERVQEFVEVSTPDASMPDTKYTCWETFYGVLAPTVRMVAGNKLIGGFDRWSEDLDRQANRWKGM